MGSMVVAGLVGSLVAIAALRRITWFGDLLALGLPAAGEVLIALSACLRLANGSTALVVVGIGMSASCGVLCVLPRRRVSASRPATSLLLASVNLQHDSRDPAATVQSALEIGADVLVVAEVTTRTHALLSEAFPFALVTQHALHVNDNAVGVYANVPFEELSAPPHSGREALRVRVSGPEPFLLYAVHLPRPVIHHDGTTGLVSLAEHRREVRRLDAAVRAEVEPVVLAGDLNLSDRTDGYRVLTSGRLDAMRTGTVPARSTYRGHWWWRRLMFRIDHCIVPRGWGVADATTFDIRGSDHRGISGRIGRHA